MESDLLLQGLCLTCQLGLLRVLNLIEFEQTQHHCCLLVYIMIMCMYVCWFVYFRWKGQASPWCGAQRPGHQKKHASMFQELKTV